MKRTALALTLILALLFSVLFVFPVQAERWSTPVEIFPKEADRLIVAPSISDDGGKIAFTAHVGWDYAIYVINWDGTGLRQLHENSMLTSSPSISGDGTKVAFGSNRLDDSLESRLGHQSKTYSDFIVANSYGTEVTVVASYLASSNDYGPSISADGRKVAFVSNSELFVVNSDGTGIKQLSTNVVYSPAISGNGSKIAFICEEGYARTSTISYPIPYPANGDIYIVNSDGTELTEVVSNLTLPVSKLSGKPYRNGPSISGDGSKIAFSASVDGDSEIFLINSDGTSLTQVTNNTVNDWNPTISDDGSKVAFSSQLTATNDIFVINSDGTGLTEITSFQSLTDYLYESDSHSINSDGSKVAFSFWGNRILVSELEWDSSTPIPTASATISPSVTPSNIEPFPTMLVIALMGSAAIVGLGLLVYFKKRQKGSVDNG